MYCPKNDFYLHLNLIERVLEEPWMEVHDIVQETGMKTIPKKKKCKRAKWLSEEALQISTKCNLKFWFKQNIWKWIYCKYVIRAMS